MITGIVLYIAYIYIYMDLTRDARISLHEDLGEGRYFELIHQSVLRTKTACTYLALQNGCDYYERSGFCILKFMNVTYRRSLCLVANLQGMSLYSCCKLLHLYNFNLSPL